ncbi:MAG TPA: hypothetical protein PLJ10_06700 [Candidatus Hydrogenedens sp.]|nr:hypothetical protein [Candidatus Hydrogenedens sp.]
MSPNIKKGCLISFLLFLVVVIVVILIVTWHVSKSYGLTKAPYIPIPTKIPPNANCQIVLRTDPALPILERVLPWEQLKSQTPIPAPQTTIPMALPYELGFWAVTEFARSHVSFSLIINEKRLGPIAYEILQTERPWENIKQIIWDKEGLTFPQRGLLSITGALKIPEGVEEQVIKDWGTQQKGISARLSSESKHLLEAYLDLKNGEILVWTASILNAQGVAWEEELRNNKFAGMAYEIAKKLEQLHIQADPSTKPDELILKAVLQARPDAQGALEFFIKGMGLPMAQDYLKTQFGILLEGNFAWDSNQSALVGDFVLKNYEGFLKTKLATLIK